MNSDDLARWLAPSEHLPVDDDRVRPLTRVSEPTAEKTDIDDLGVEHPRRQHFSERPD